MATAYSRTREQLRDKVMRKLRVLGADESPSSADADIVYEGIDLRLKQLHHLGVLWWKTSAAQTSVALTANVATANAPSDLLFPVSALFMSGTDQIQLDLLTHREYQAIEDKTQTGEPEVVHYSNGVFYFWPVPEVNSTAKITYEKIIDNTAASTAVDVPAWALLSVASMVASDLADDFQLPEDRVGRLFQEAQVAERKLMVLNAPVDDGGIVESEYF